MTRDIAVLKTAQDLLGRLHDLEVLIQRARDERVSSFLPSLNAWRELRSLVRALEDDCRALHGDYMHHRAKLITIANRVAGLDADPVAGRRATG